MLLKIVTAFLILMAVLALFGRLRFPGGPPRITGPRRCPDCGRHRIGRGPCDCRGPRIT
jgi:hypothetical protein